MAITVVQHASATSQFTSGTSGTCAPAFASNTTAGNCLVACFSHANGVAAPTITVTTNGTTENWAAAVSNVY